METTAVYLVITFLAGLGAVLIRLPPLAGFLVAAFVLHFLDSAYGIGRPPFLQTLADLGVTLLLFGIGLKLDIRTLTRREVWLTNGTHMAISTALGIGFLLLLGAFGFGLLADASFSTYALVAFALSFSSTVVVVKLLDERSDTSALYGRIAIGVLIMQDLAAVLFLTISKGKPPSILTLGLLLLVPLTWLLRKAWRLSGHGELHSLFGILVALGFCSLPIHELRNSHASCSISRSFSSSRSSSRSGKAASPDQRSSCCLGSCCCFYPCRRCSTSGSCGQWECDIEPRYSPPSPSSVTANSG